MDVPKDEIREFVIVTLALCGSPWLVFLLNIGCELEHDAFWLAAWISGVGAITFVIIFICEKIKEARDKAEFDRLIAERLEMIRTKQ